MPVTERSLPTTVIRKTKRGEGWGRWPAYMLSEDSYGVWLYTPCGSIYRARVGARVVELEVGQGDRDAGIAVVQLLPSRWWTATWWDGLGLISVDVCTPPRFVDGEWMYFDLELDPHRYADGRVVIEDEDEFTAKCEAGAISSEEAVAATAAAEEVGRALRSRAEPFGDVGWSRLEEGLLLELPPLVELDDPVTA